MQLSDYSVDDLQTLQLAIAFAKQCAAKEDTAFTFNCLDRWNDRIKEAIKDRAFEDEFRDATVFSPRQTDAESSNAFKV